MSKRRWLFALLLTLVPVTASGQSTGTIQGTVVDATTQAPLSSVQVSVRNSALGTLTDDQGRFQIVNVPAGEHFVRAQLIGFGADEERVVVSAGSAATVTLALTQTAIEVEGLVVTALGIERAERSLTTSVEEVNAEDLTEAREPNLVTALTGKVAGVTITNSNTPGGSSRIVIRGANSLTGNNQPLFVIDGVPVSNAAGSGGTTGYNAIDYGNVIQDINPDDIESLSVLKGPNAAALYGSRAANGAILITTKNGRRASGTAINASTNVSFETPLKLPTYQNKYGQGAFGEYSYLDGRGNGVNDGTDESWGPRLDNGLMIPQFFSNGEAVPWVSHPDNVRNFFDTGRTVNTSASFATNSDNSNVRFSISRMDQEGMYPSFELERTNVALSGGSNLTDRLRTDVSVQYLQSDGANRPPQGYGEDNVMWQFLWFGRQVDTSLLEARQFNEDGTQFNWNSRWNNNPYWTALVNSNSDVRDRIIGSASLSFDVTPWLTAMVRSGTDWYQEERRREYAADTRGISGENGAFGETDIFRQETNTDFMLSGSWAELGDFSLNVDVGGNRRNNNYRNDGIYVEDLVVPGVYARSNAAVEPSLSDYRERKRVNSLFGIASIGYRDILFVDVTGRNDWSSTLPEDNNSYFYPSISSSLVFSDLIDVPGLSFGKLNAGWAQVGSDAAPYQLVDPYGADVPFGGVPRLSASNTLRNANLKPEQTEGWEIGTDLVFLGDRLGVQATYYSKSTTNQIIPLQISPITGFTSRYINAGKLSNEGVELSVDAVPVRLANGFEWDVTVNYTRNRDYVDELYGDLETMVLGSYYNVSVEARKGERYGAMYGRMYVRDPEGNIVVDSDGLPLNSSDNPVGLLGNYNPDWVGSINNRLSYKGLDLSFLFDTRQGGVIYSMTHRYGQRSGVLIETLEGRENSIDDGLIVEGVQQLEDGSYVPNTTVTDARSYHRGIGAITENSVFDASFVKLREMRLGYNVPRSLTQRWGVSGLRVALVGRNLALWSDVPHIDPETAFNASNVQGFEYSQMPSARSIGFNISVTP
ncbi:MAG TPA: SusC/RagA family TonB-linked outer membrane protein [Longimicrobiaceae bacterium]|nr:SusC/RagA family TonB-linked outer membrane protein [Longimicrobiaceae bacterium]